MTIFWIKYEKYEKGELLPGRGDGAGGADGAIAPPAFTNLM